MFKKGISLFLSLSLIITQPIFAQGVAQLNLAQYLGQARPAAIDSFRPTQLRYFSYDNLNNSFRILLDKGDAKDIKDTQLKQEAKELMDYFLIGLTLPNDAFWVNLRPDSPDNIIDPELEKTDLGRILLEADLQLKKDTAGLTSPQTSEGKAYWDKLYKKAGELFGTENITIPTITRPWIVPGEIIVRESGNSAYIYKANLKVMLEADYLNNQKTEKPKNQKTEGYSFPDSRLKELNEYSSQIIRETIIPKLIQEVNSSKRYAKLRQVYYSLVLSRWFKMRFSGKSGQYADLIDRHNLTNLTAKEPYDKLTYFKQYQESFAKGEYNLKEPVYTPYGQSIRTYMSGGFNAGNEALIISGVRATVGNSIVAESLKKRANIVPLEISGNSLQIEFTNQEQRLAIAASPVVINYEFDNPEGSIIKAYKYAVHKDILNGYEYSIIAESLHYNPMLAAYKMGRIIKNKLPHNQIKKDFMRNDSGGYDYGFIHDAKELDNWLDWLTSNDISRIRESVNGVLDSISSMLPQGSSLKNSINNQKMNIEDIANNYIGIIEVLNAVIDAFDKELPTAEINRGSSNADLNAAESELRKMLSIVLIEAIISKIYNIPEFNKQIPVEIDLYINDFKSAINRIPRDLYMSNDEYFLLNKALKNLPGQRKDYFVGHSNVVPAGKLLMLELEKSMGELASELQAVKDEFGLSHVEWAESAADLIFFPVYRKYRKKLLEALTDMQDRIEEIKKSYNILIDAGDNFDHSIDALMESSEDLRDTLFQARGYLNYIFSKRFSADKGNKLEVLRNNYELVSGNYFLSGKEILNRDFPKRYEYLYDTAYRVFSALEKYEDYHKILKSGWEKYKTDPSSAASPLITLKKKINEVLFEAIEKKINDQGLLNYQEELAVFLKNLKKDLEGPVDEIDNIVNTQGTLKDTVKAIERVSTILFNRENEIGSIHMDIKSMMVSLRRYELPSFMREIEKSLGQRETTASPVVLEYEVAAIQVVREKLNEYHSGSIKDFSKVALSDLIASLNGTAKKIEEEKGSESYEEQKEWIDIAKELSKVKAEVEKNIEMYREQLFSFYAGIKQNPDIKSGEGQKLDYNEYSQTIKATNDPDEIIAAAELAYKLVHGAASPLGLAEFKIEGINSNESIAALKELTGLTIEEIEYRARPGVYSRSGFISSLESFKDVLKKDNTFVLGKNLTHQKLAIPLLKALECCKYESGYFEYNNIKFVVKATRYRGMQMSIFNDGRTTNADYVVTNTINGKTISFSGLIPYYVNDYGFYEGSVNYRLEPKDIIDFFGITASSGLTSESQPSVPFGGIDFTDQAMKIGIERIGSFADLKLVVPEVSNAAAIDLDNEFKQIQLMASSGIRPSDIRILEFAAACYYRGEFGARMGEITSCLQQAHFLDERLGRESSEALRLATMLPEVM